MGAVGNGYAVADAEVGLGGDDVVVGQGDGDKDGVRAIAEDGGVKGVGRRCRLATVFIAAGLSVNKQIV